MKFRYEFLINNNMQAYAYICKYLSVPLLAVLVSPY